MNFEPNRLILRQLTMNDFEDLHEILSDPKSMKHYPAPFTRKKTMRWIDWNLRNYEVYGFGLWAVILKDDNVLIGDCGITMQRINGDMEPEIGYHINKSYTCKGYATEAAKACMNYAFDVLKFQKVYYYMSNTNTASQKVAVKNGMKLIAELSDDTKRTTKIYAITKDEYLKLKND